MADVAPVPAPAFAGRLRAALSRPVPADSLAAYRILFGILLFGSTIRFMANGWLKIFYEKPTYWFSYEGFEWVRVLPGWGMTALYVGIAAAALLVALGLFYRVAIVSFLVLFAYAELTDVTNYLNHYYLVVLMSLLMGFLPMAARGSLDARRRPSSARSHVPAWMLYLLRFQVAVVYVHAGLAKAGSDWLFHAQPLGIWLQARDETPLFGPLFAQPWTAYAFSWAGFLFDSTIVLWLLWKRSRPAAFAVLLAFHGMTQVLFDIGIFPLLMTVNATLFLDPDWPSRLWARLRRRSSPAPAAPAAPFVLPGRAVGALVLCFCLFQALFPLRSRLHPGDVLWHEQGMRWSWRVMVREKSGSITYHVRDPKTGRAWQVDPSAYLTLRQQMEMSGQPDLILQLAQRVGADYAAQLGRPVEVRAEAKVSLNGRASRLLIDPSRDLMGVRTGWARADWILPGPTEPPLRRPPMMGKR